MATHNGTPVFSSACNLLDPILEIWGHRQMLVPQQSLSLIKARPATMAEPMLTDEGTLPADSNIGAGAAMGSEGLSGLSLATAICSQFRVCLAQLSRSL